MLTRFKAPDHPLVFLHLPKTAGSTFNAVLQRHFAPDRVHFLRSDRMEENIAAFCAMPEAARHRIQLLRGHQAFGLHRWLAPGARYLTVLRDPVDRVISHYHYVRSTRHPRFIGAIEAGQLDLLGYVTSGISGELENGQTRWLAGRLDDAPLGAADLERALDHLERHFDWVGLIERFDESLVDLGLQYRWLGVHYRSRNVGRERQRVVDPRVVEAIRARNALDLQLYRHAELRMNAVGGGHAVFRAAGARLLRLANRVGQRLRPSPDAS